MEVVQAQEQVAGAESDYISSLFSFNLAKLTLARATGGAEIETPGPVEGDPPMKTHEEELPAGNSAPEAPAAEKTPATRGRRRAFFIFFVDFAVAGAAGFLYWFHERQFESTDDAQVEAHLNPISARIDGTITHVYVDDNQTVRKGDPLVDLDPRDYQVALDQALAQVAQARSMVIAQQPNVPITQVENTTNISSGEADVANARAAMSAAERDREAAAAQVRRIGSQQRKGAGRSGALPVANRKRRSRSRNTIRSAAAAKAQAATLPPTSRLAFVAQIVEQRARSTCPSAKQTRSISREMLLARLPSASANSCSRNRRVRKPLRRSGAGAAQARLRENHCARRRNRDEALRRSRRRIFRPDSNY